MAFLHRNENSATGGANFSGSAQCSFDGRTVITDLDNLGREKNGVVCRGRPEQFDGVFRGDRATVEGTLNAGGKVCATCRGLFVAVKEGHPAYHRW